MLIESFLMNIPVPPVYLSEDDFGKYSVIDGKQRITAIHEYMRGRFSLTMLERFPELNGYKFSQLPPQLSNALLVRPYIRAVTLLRQSDWQTKYEVFHRLNSGGEPLNAQEIRNVLYRGPLNDLLVKLSDAPFLRRQLKIRDARAPAYRAMADVEYVLRFLTLKDSWQKFSGDFRESMDNFMARHQNIDNHELSGLEGDFNRTLQACEEIWGFDAFKRPDKDGWRDQTLAGMYDSQMVAVSLFTEREIRLLTAAKDDVVAATRELFSDENFEAAVRVATNTPARVKYRIGKMHAAMLKIAR
ncbi:protein of unknown function DUF262 [Parafrankia sp. EUN1f]|nr:protein of unknown function DUF262 [Parafrankia sp. EUN1f]